MKVDIRHNSRSYENISRNNCILNFVTYLLEVYVSYVGLVNREFTQEQVSLFHGYQFEFTFIQDNILILMDMNVLRKSNFLIKF